MSRGYTLIEMIMYIALFSILMTTGFGTAFQLVQSTDSIASKVTSGDETTFVLRKIDWLLSGTTTAVTVISQPTVLAPYATSLVVTKAGNGSNPVTIRFNAASSSIEMKEGSGVFMRLTSENVKVTSLGFKYIAGTGTAPDGIIATTTIQGVIATTTRYIRK